MNADDVEEELAQIKRVPSLRFTVCSALTPEDWEELETKNYLSLHIGHWTYNGELSLFMAELLSRRENRRLEAVYLLRDYAYNPSEPGQNKQLIPGFRKALSAKSRVYLQ